MSLRNCETCGIVFVSQYEKLCITCSQQFLAESHKVKDFVRHHPRATLIEVYHQTGVPLKTIKHLMQA
ncbi:hypothetical protein ACFPES_12940 [Paenibacillus sp. GCM10023248]|uniref:hypothetical protein n=1 Tax=unclassified Paenibacillus TaxID=185978 RepID=UPI002378E4A4|nr:hypothetical protein [Paenibacillus sp. MAHUQ-63]MDD9267936.1 hypothetical protein [Paenibacillus sp. MAHUQ-63]MDR6882368.1 hypothetical protein [Bacillus sp. 3255]